MSATTLWVKHRPLALGIARDYRIPGLDADDVRQEALVALWEAALSFDPARGTFGAFARTVVKRHLIDQLEFATRKKRTAVFDHQTEAVDKTDRLNARMELRDLIAAMDERLSNREFWAVIDQMRGLPGKSSKGHDNALTRARQKLREVA